ncbi:MAG: carboxypeptidase regulatory-like domain-containing protein, partial [Deltaproteobacteria bacterium]|nr:carboxypeptidase regulatory-like domain-containing protein [Deltaproteobacteria bacterium]
MNKKSSLWALILIGALLSSCSKEQEKPAMEHAPASRESTPQSLKPGSMTGTGTVTGKIAFKGNYNPGAFSIGKDREVCGTSKSEPALVVSNQGEVRDAVVQVVGVSGKATASQEAVLDQSKCEYAPHVMVIPAGTTIRIRNSDGILHNVHTYSKINSPFNRAQPKFLKEFDHTFEKAENVSVECDVHGWMSGWIVVTDAAHYGISGADGRFTLSNVPAGEHTLE